MSALLLPPVRPTLAALLLGASFLSAGCTEAGTDPFAQGPGPVEVPIPPVEATLDTRSSQPGIVFASFSMPNAYLNSVHTGWMQGGALDPNNIMTQLSGARAKGGRVIMKLCKGQDRYVKNSDGTFSLSKWKSLVARYKDTNFDPYLRDGTIIGHYLIDEPHRAVRWGGKAISQATLEEMARFSKQLWPSMTTIVRVAPSYLASSSVTYQALDAGWTQYGRSKGDPKQWVTAEAAAAKRKGLGLVVGMNVLDGGDGSSGIPGRTRGKYAMSAKEIRTIGAAMLSESYACGFFNWTHDTDYYERSDIKTALKEVSSNAKQHAKTSCRQ